MEPCKEIKTIMSLLSQQKRTQKDLTDYLGITQNAFTDWKSGRIKSWNKHLPQIAEFLGVTVDYILGKEKSPTAESGEGLTGQEEVLIELFRSTDEITKAKIIVTVEEMVTEAEQKALKQNSSAVG